MATEHRKQYLAKIDREEKEARKLIKSFKWIICRNKFTLNSLIVPKDERERVCRNIKYCQHRIALVKKHLPATVYKAVIYDSYDERTLEYKCSDCKKILSTHIDYCPYCGKRLRW